jgi:hypothetical protein
MSFKGMFFCYTGDHIAYGEIINQFDNVLLLKLQSGSDPECHGNIIATHTDMVLETFDDEYFAQWTFFETQENLDKYIAWMDSFETKPTVVSLVKK